MSDSKEAARAQELELTDCKGKPWRWLTHWAQTEDAENKEHPFQQFPNKLHLQVLAEHWTKERYLLFPKSRQMTCTWLVVGLYLHDSLFFPSRSTIFQCKVEEDADKNLQRAKVIHDRLPEWMRAWQPMVYTYCNTHFPRSRSHIRAVPAGAKHFRQNTLSGVMVDEACFTEEMDGVLAAAKPALGKNGRFTALSSAAPSYFADLTFDRI